MRVQGSVSMFLPSAVKVTSVTRDDSWKYIYLYRWKLRLDQLIKIAMRITLYGGNVNQKASKIHESNPITKCIRSGNLISIILPVSLVKLPGLALSFSTYCASGHQRCMASTASEKQDRTLPNALVMLSNAAVLAWNLGWCFGFSRMQKHTTKIFRMMETHTVYSMHYNFLISSTFQFRKTNGHELLVIRETACF